MTSVVGPITHSLASWRVARHLVSKKNQWGITDYNDYQAHWPVKYDGLSLSGRCCVGCSCCEHYNLHFTGYVTFLLIKFSSDRHGWIRPCSKLRLSALYSSEQVESVMFYLSDQSQDSNCRFLLWADSSAGLRPALIRVKCECYVAATSSLQ